MILYTGVKGNVSLMSSDPPFKGNAGYTMVSLKAFLIKCELDINVLLFSLLEKWLYFMLRRKSHKHFSCQNVSISSTFLIRFRFQSYRCKSGIVIFSWKVIITLTVAWTLKSRLYFFFVLAHSFLTLSPWNFMTLYEESFKGFLFKIFF